jgi:hypothetical protein
MCSDEGLDSHASTSSSDPELSTLKKSDIKIAHTCEKHPSSKVNPFRPQAMELVDKRKELQQILKDGQSIRALTKWCDACVTNKHRKNFDSL